MGATGTDDGTDDGSNRMNAEVDRATLSAQIQSDDAKPIGQHFTAEMDNDPKHYMKHRKRFFRQRNKMFLNDQVSQPN